MKKSMYLIFCTLVCQNALSANLFKDAIREVSQQVKEVEKLAKPVEKNEIRKFNVDLNEISNSERSTAEKSADLSQILSSVKNDQIRNAQFRSLKKYSPKIIGGNTVAFRQYPWQVALIRNTPPFRQFCGGTLISQEWVLTAAHCVDEGTLASDVIVLTGTDFLDMGTKIKVNKIITHENYVTPVVSGFDIALLKLSEPSTETTISIIDPSEESSLAHAGTFAWVTGWGITELGMPSIQLKEVDVRIIHEDECNSNQMYDGVISDSMICAGHRIGGKDSCQGDSGGPLMVVDRKGGLKQVGVVSWGEGCALENRPGVYTRLAVMADWISAKRTANQIGATGE
jgi:secreted trypsin-like serine protease